MASPIHFLARRVGATFLSVSRNPFSKTAFSLPIQRAMSKFAPPVNREMKVLDKLFFDKEVPLVVVRFPDAKHIAAFNKRCRKDVLAVPYVKHIVYIDGGKGVLLRDDVQEIDGYKDKVDADTVAAIEEYGAKVEPYSLKLTYDFWKADDILKAVIPEELQEELPTGFAQAGHVAHFNLKREFKPYGELIGQVILDKNPKVETVVDKLDSIDTKFRTFEMKVLAGKPDMMVEQQECGCRFKFDFSKVYWNSRLNTEHERLVKVFPAGEVVADVFAGVGPFAVPAGKKRALVLANDLNPESYKYLKENIKLNKVEDVVKPFELDGRAFIRKSPQLLLDWAAKDQIIEKSKVVKKRKIDPVTKQNVTVRETSTTRMKVPKYISQFVMNLPASALEFLNEFIGLYADVQDIVKADPEFKLPIVNVHCFEKYSRDEPEPTMEELERRVHARIADYINFPIPFEDCHFHVVRYVAPTKPMFCVSFTLPEEVAFKQIA